MKIKLSIFLFLLGFGAITAQQHIVSFILDSESKEPVPFVNISIVGENIGTVSELDGQFKLQHTATHDSIILSSVGYKTRTISLQDVKSNQPILMQPMDYEIEEVQIVRSNFDQERILGERNENGRGHSFGFGSAQLGTELGTLVEIKKETFIKSVHFVLNHAKGDSLLLRVNIYDYQKGRIGKKLLKQNVILKEKQRKGTFSIDLSAYEIILYNDVLLSIEWLRNFGETGNKSITFDTKKPKSSPGTFIRYASNAAFERLSYKKKYKPCIYFIGKQSAQ